VNSAHVAGLAVYLMGLDGRPLGPEDLAKRIADLAISSLKGDIPVTTTKSIAFNNSPR
jgi:hypothetical protein